MKWTKLISPPHYYTHPISSQITTSSIENGRGPWRTPGAASHDFRF